MAKGFACNNRDSRSKKQRQDQAFRNLKQCRDRILSLAWQGYLTYGSGVIHFQETEDGGKINYIQRQDLTDPEVLQVLDRHSPQLAAVVLYDYNGWYDILTLSGSQTPSECYRAEQRDR